jgi:hypothetical protein
MNKFLSSSFDFFTYALPGSFLVAAFFILDPSQRSLGDYLVLSAGFNVGKGVLLLVLGYSVGFAVTPLGRALYRRVGFPLFRHRLPEQNDLTVSQKYVLLREYAPNNFRYVETWNFMCGMAHNFCLAALLVASFAGFKVLFLKPAEPGFWTLIAALSLVLTPLFLYQAVKFSLWAADDINNAIDLLKLRERAGS